MYDGDNVLLEVDSQGQQLAANTWGSKLICRQAEDQRMYYWYNGHGDVVALLDTFGNVVGMYTYDAFGVPVESTDKHNNPYRYAGYIYDEESGLYYLRTRFYKAEIGRFIQRDTFAGNDQDPMSLNRYTYCQNEPVMYHDPVGQAGQAVTNVYRKEMISFDPNEKGKSRIYVDLGEKFPMILREGIHYDLIGDKAYFREGQQDFKAKTIITSASYRLLTDNLQQSGLKVTSFGGERGRRYVTATNKNGNAYVFRENVDFSIFKKRAYVSWDVSGNMIPAPVNYFDNSYKVQPIWSDSDKVESYLYWKAGVYLGDSDYYDYWESALNIANTIIKERQQKEKDAVIGVSGGLKIVGAESSGLAKKLVQKGITNKFVIIMDKAVERSIKKLSPEARKGFEKAIQGLESGDMRGLNSHRLTNNKLKEWAIDIPGIGKGRGSGRLCYIKNADGSITITRIITDHRY